MTYVGAKVLKGETLDSVDAELGVGLDNGETTGHYTARPLLVDGGQLAKDQICGMSQGARVGRTEVLLGGTALLNDLNKTGLELLDGGNVVGKDTHITGGGGNVDLGTVVAKVRQYLEKGRRHRRHGRKRKHNIHASRAVDGLSSNRQVSTSAMMLGGRSELVHAPGEGESGTA
jgi:hypothetical protein